MLQHQLCWNLVRCFLLLCILGLIGGGAMAQIGTATVRGTIEDPQGNAVAGATVSLANEAKSFIRTQTSNQDGGYVFSGIPPGTYQIEVEASGFRKAVVTGVAALVDKAVTVDVRLEVGAVTESVTVSAGASELLVNTQDATIGNNFEARQITQLPLESRNVVQLLSLQPGVTSDGYVTGSRADQANVTLDGVDVNEQQTGLDPITGEAFSSVLRVTPDSVQEFRVTTINPNANQGRSAGAQVSLITKSGSNEFHGSLYWFHRNTVTTANDFFNNRSGVERPALLRNLFGGSISGPIKKNRAFFFYTYEGRRDSSQQSVVRVVPRASLGRGQLIYPNSAGGISQLSTDELNRLFPDVRMNPVAIAALAEAARRYPVNDNTEGDGFNTGGYRFNAATPLRWNTNIARLDFNLTEDGRHLLFLRANYQQDTIGRVPQFPDTPAPNFWNHPWGVAVGHTWTISNALVNTFRYGLTREAFTNQGDSAENQIFFRFVFSPRIFSRGLSRTTPVHNIVNDMSWLKGSHNFQFGTNIRAIRNNRISFATAFDSAIANPSFYDLSGAVLSQPFTNIAPGFTAPVRNAVCALIGRYSQYQANFNFNRDGSLRRVGAGNARKFATEEYDWYFMDTWKLHPTLTLTWGLRYSLSRPVYEATGFQVKPTTSLGEFFEARKVNAARGIPVNDLITVDLAGPKNRRPGYYNWDTNNYQPRVALAWSPNPSGGFWRKLLGGDNASVFRGGFSITNDYIGQQLAVQFDLNNTLGFSSSQVIAANTYNVTDRPGPLFTSFGQDVRSLPGIRVPSRLTFPLMTPADEDQRIESSLDDTIRSPRNYSWSVSYGRQLPGGFFLELSYVGRLGRDLLATRDIMALNNLVDPRSGMDWYTAAGLLANYREQNTPLTAVPRIPYFENLFPGFTRVVGGVQLTPTQTVYRLVARDRVNGLDILDWTFIQLLIDDRSVLGRNIYFHPQYAALATFSTIADSDYHAGTLTVRQRLGNQLSFDLNYTLSKSMDNASGLQTSGAYGSAFILNPLQPEANRAESDFDIRHIINANALWQIPIGRGRKYLGGMSRAADALLGGWQLSGIFRWNSGLPAQTPFDAQQWATNWNVQSNGVRNRPIKSSPTKSGPAPNLFKDPVFAYRSFRNAYPGETGDRNVLRLPGYVTLDAGLGKSFTMPWSENHTLQFRWEVFNVSNTQRLGDLLVTRVGLGLDIDPHIGNPAPNFGNFVGIQGSPRVMQFAFRYEF
ncbi:MAG: carboxypeptidase-like regulatory domain-containing protein [Acidobacteriota bacterium]|nr:carboxypeptidase-like regulatory domain-containing protein [Blastocatellia bacterium]MDW8238414.1 carboxypeptidase-like regulatory domain-containing protein [Acidobacteriota bacterium]